MLKSFYVLFGIPPPDPLRATTCSSVDAGKEHEVCAYVGTLIKGRAACGRTVGECEVRSSRAKGGDALHPCFTGVELPRGVELSTTGGGLAGSSWGRTSR